MNKKQNIELGEVIELKDDKNHDNNLTEKFSELEKKFDEDNDSFQDIKKNCTNG